MSKDEPLRDWARTTEEPEPEILLRIHEDLLGIQLTLASIDDAVESIRTCVQFFVWLGIIVLVLGGCSILL